MDSKNETPSDSDVTEAVQIVLELHFQRTVEALHHVSASEGWAAEVRRSDWFVKQFPKVMDTFDKSSLQWIARQQVSEPERIACALLYVLSPEFRQKTDLLRSCLQVELGIYRNEV